jgi:nucleotide-binding STING sensor domain-containing protein
MPPPLKRRCFVIGPMSGPHMDTLNWLAHDVVKPLMPDDFDVATPDAPDIGNIMTHVIQSCDRAHLVIANTTGNNPNVLYEIAVLDAMGRACIPVKIAEAEQDEKDAKDDRMAFDRAAYRVFRISRSPDRREETNRILGEAIRKAMTIREAGDMYQNPLTDFFGVPLSSFSSAYALARGYYLNLLKPAVKKLAEGARPDGSAFDPNKHRRKVLQVVIPGHLGQVSRKHVDDIFGDGKLIKQVKIPAPGRPITLHEWVQQDGPDFRWLDIPTTMVGLRETVLGRRGRHANPDPKHPDYRELELDEIEQFERAFLGLMLRDQGGDEERGMIEVVRWAETPLPQ